MGVMSTMAIPSGAEATPDRRTGIVVLSDVRFVQDALVTNSTSQAKSSRCLALRPSGATRWSRASTSVPTFCWSTPNTDGLVVVRRIRQLAPLVRIVALALAEREDEVIAWVEAGASGYVPRSAALDELVAILEGAMRGEQVCSPRVASCLVRRLAVTSRHPGPAPPVVLTRRELEIVQLVNEELSNKEIASQLEIGLATTKSHVHNVLAKLGLARRSQAAQWIREQSRLVELQIAPKLPRRPACSLARSPGPPWDGCSRRG